MLLVASLWLVARVARRLWPSVAPLWPVLLVGASFVFVRKTLEVRPDPLMNLFVLAALSNWVAYLTEHPRRLRRALRAGLLFGLALVVLQKAAVIAALTGGAALPALVATRDAARRRTLAAGLALLAAGAALPVALFLAWVAASGSFGDFYFWNYEFNRWFYLHAPLDEHFSAFVSVGQSVAWDPVLWLAGLAGLALVVRATFTRRRALLPVDEARLTVALAAAGSLAFLFWNRFPFGQYQLTLLPLLGLLACEVFARAQATRCERPLRVASLAMAALLALTLALAPSSNAQREVQRAILAGTSRADTVAVSPPHHPVFRRDASFFWYNGRMIGASFERYCATRRCARDVLLRDRARWDERPPRFVFLDPEYDKYWPHRWSERAPGYGRRSPASCAPGRRRLRGRCAAPT